MDFTSYTRKPFVVDAVQITEDNIDEIAKKIGDGVVVRKDGKTYIPIDRRVVPNISRAFVGWWLTSMNDNLRCYSGKVFAEQFESTVATGDIQERITNAVDANVPEDPDAEGQPLPGEPAETV